MWCVKMEEQLNNKPVEKNDLWAIAALFSGVIAIPMSIGIIPGIILGVAAITFGIISRINYEKFHLQNILGITFGGISIFLSAVMFLGYLMLLQDPEVMQYLYDMTEMYYGQ